METDGRKKGHYYYRTDERQGRQNSLGDKRLNRRQKRHFYKQEDGGGWGL